MKTGIIVRALLAALALTGACRAEETHTLQKITVRRSLYNDNSSTLSNVYPHQTIALKEIEEKHLNSISEVLDYAWGIDLRHRGTSGIQADTSLLGSTYEQVAVLIDGVKIMDPQTGHFNLDIPLTAYDVERVEVIEEPASSLYGAGAFAGSVNIITKKTDKRALNLEGVYGENALAGQTFSCTLPGENISGRFSFDHKKAKAARPNTDFEYENAVLRLDGTLGRTMSNTTFGWQKKDFGADSFYSNLFPEEEEHTQTLFVNSATDTKFDKFSLKNNLYLRKHRDKFILTRNNPVSANYHTTYVYGLESNACAPLKIGDLSFGIDAAEELINSTNLGKHSRMHEAWLFSLVSQWGGRLNTDLRFRADHFQKWSWHQSANAGAGYKLIGDKLRLKGSFAMGFRLPTFTELYYSDPGNRGNPDLNAEKNYTFSGGLDFEQSPLRLGAEVFLRRGYNLIDWTRISTALPWQATNLGRVDFKGITFSSRVNANLSSRLFNLRDVSLSYTYMDADKKVSGFLSKYALDILMHQLNLGLASGFLGLKFDWQLSYNKRYYGETYFVGNLYISKRLVTKSFSLEPFLKIDNFTNAKYSEVGQVLQPGRWVQGGAKIEW